MARHLRRLQRLGRRERTCREWGCPVAVGSNCVCAGFGRWLHAPNVNNGEILNDHLCYSHQQWIWNGVVLSADQELTWRRHNIPRKKSGHDWTRPKRQPVGAHGVLKRDTRTPWQRRADTHPIPGGNAALILFAGHAPQGRLDPVPRCFCGAKINAAGHARTGPADPLAPNGEPVQMRVRNCVGCHGWIRNW